MRFTIDGSEELEELLAGTCREIGRAVCDIVPRGDLQALVLGGGYGRGEGGVLKTETGDAPYNDLEFFVFISGSPRRNERIFGDRIFDLGHRMTERIGIEVEFKILSLEKLRSDPTTMFYYDLVSGHRIVEGPSDALRDCTRHGDAAAIPLHEATRLLMNRCSGLLFAAERLGREPFTAEDADFTGRNIAKAQLALGDVVLAALGKYNWSCLRRHERLKALRDIEKLPMAELLDLHRDGVAFKLHPFASTAGRSELTALHGRIRPVAWAVWQWLEGRRLGIAPASPMEYGRTGDKCPETGWARNAAIRLKTFGIRGVMGIAALRYPREALLNTLPLLLWSPELAGGHHAWISRQFVRPVTDWR